MRLFDQESLLVVSMLAWFTREFQGAVPNGSDLSRVSEGSC